MKHLAIIFCIAVVVVSFLYFYLPSEPAGPVDLLTFNYSAVSSIEDCPKVNVTGVIDNVCLLPQLPLWTKAGAGDAGGQIAITVRGCPGTQMSVVDVQQVGNTTWFEVQKHEVRDDLQMYWQGWVTEKSILQGPLPVLKE